jgi:hypothetical protein
VADEDEVSSRDDGSAESARRTEPLPGVPFRLEALANAFVLLGLLSRRHTG